MQHVTRALIMLSHYCAIAFCGLSCLNVDFSVTAFKPYVFQFHDYKLMLCLQIFCQTGSSRH